MSAADCLSMSGFCLDSHTGALPLDSAGGLPLPMYPVPTLSPNPGYATRHVLCVNSYSTHLGVIHCTHTTVTLILYNTKSFVWVPSNFQSKLRLEFTFSILRDLWQTGPT